ncbi:MAG: YcbK family protein [Woeseiaceae bacterium]
MLAIAVTLILASLANANQGRLDDDERQLSFYHTHTGQRLDVVYARDGAYVPSALEEINQFLFDFRTGDAARMDPELLDLIYDVRAALNSNGTYQIVSAYRSPKTNEMLRGRSKNTGVAKNSQHLLGKAIDVRLEGVKTADLRDTALALRRGGVGFYEASDFVHMDTGRPRSW